MKCGIKLIGDGCCNPGAKANSHQTSLKQLKQFLLEPGDRAQLDSQA